MKNIKHTSPENTMKKDPVCDMEVAEGKAAAIGEYKGETYYFCAVKCKERFLENPESFLLQPEGIEEKSEDALKTATDPICGMKVDVSRAAGKSIYKNGTYYFCNLNCKNKFDSNPEAALHLLKKEPQMKEVAEKKGGAEPIPST